MAKLEAGTENETSVGIHYEDEGSGDPVVLIHGWPLSGRSWSHQVPALVDAGYRVIAYDRRGFGESSQPEAGYDYDGFTADLTALMNELDLKDATLVGFSMGGGEVARYVANEGTDRVKKAVFAAAVPPYLYKSDDNPDGGLDDETIGQFEEGVKSDREGFVDQFLHDFFAAGDKDDLVSEEDLSASKEEAMKASPKAFLDCIAAFGRTDFREDLEKFDIPTLVIHGDSDAIVPFEVSGRRTADTIDGSELIVVEGGPHGMNATHADEFNEALLKFLAS